MNQKNKNTRSLSSIFIENGITLILYPPYIDSSNAIASILTVSDVVNTTVFIMTKDSSLINAAAGQDLSSKIYLKYGNDKYVNSAQSKESFIMFDSLNTFRKEHMDEHLKGRSPKCKLIIFGSMEINSVDEKYIKKIFPKYGILSYCISKHQIGLSYKIEQTIMTEEQSQLYLSNPDKIEDTFLKIGNFNYSTQIQDNVSRDTDKGDNGWMSSSILGEILKISPKIHNLLTIVISQYADKHVIYTQFKESHGVDLLDTLFNYLNIFHTIITKDNDENEQIGKISTFCEDPVQKVLIMNTVPKAEINEVCHVHFLEGVEELTMLSFINSIYKARLFSKTMPLSCNIHFHIASIDLELNKDKLIGIDEKMYTDIANSIIDRQNVYDGLMKKSQQICHVREKGMCVI